MIIPFSVPLDYYHTDKEELLFVKDVPPRSAGGTTNAKFLCLSFDAGIQYQIEMAPLSITNSVGLSSQLE
jgi:hypothetical protein